jgi:hypothetical protein
MGPKRWRELSRRQQAIIVAAGFVQELLSAATLLDLRRRPSTQVRGSKKLWVAAAFVNFVGPIGLPPGGRTLELCGHRGR